MQTEFRTYDLNELSELAKATTPTRVSVILDKTAVDFLLSLHRDEERVDDEKLDDMVESIEEDVLQTLGEMSVSEERLTDGWMRLRAIQKLDCPESYCATVVFGSEQQE